ncbi:MAG: hypothetical protein BAJALOKI2v1_300041 [Promethearchaeota archaeon]|nr:MAG: hypothetical protein BAJALOKI2v1_300041 [Candidatus Lokiarchaeota archaeon]
MNNIVEEDELDIEELEFYTKILNTYQKEDMSRQEKEMWKNRTYVKLMKILERTNNINVVRNSLILILTLFENIPPDLFNNRGINIELLSEGDKDKLFEQLKEEFSN